MSKILPIPVEAWQPAQLPAPVTLSGRWVTLEPGDLIFTGTPGSTSKLNPGDVVEVDIEGIGVLRNPVA